MKLGINIDHVATLRQARRGIEPSIARAALEAIRAGADSITVHLREDRRHIQDLDLWDLKKILKKPLNLEMALEADILDIAIRLHPAKVCLVPERRQEITTEGGLDIVGHESRLRKMIPRLQAKDIEVSLFIHPDPGHIRLSADLGADAIEIHTGTYTNAKGPSRTRELKKIKEGARLAKSLGLKVHAGHGLDYENVFPIIAVPEIVELNIGHSIISRAVFDGIYKSVLEMKRLIRKYRK